MNVGQVSGALEAATGEQPTEKVKKQLLKIWDLLATQLQQSLVARTKDRTSGLEKRLQERAVKEAADIESVLTELKTAIEKELNDPEYKQLELFSDPEKEQLERNKDFLRARVQQIPDEIVQETEAIKARFAEPQSRMFPVAVTFLVPRKMAK